MSSTNDSGEWIATFLHQLEAAWNKNALESEFGGHDAAVLKAVAGFALATQLATATTNAEIIDIVSTHGVAITDRLGDDAETDMFHSALVNLCVTFLKPALDVLQGSDRDVREVARLMWEAIQASDHIEP
jgi:hypothetical protein